MVKMNKIVILFTIFILCFTSIIPIQEKAHPEIRPKNEKFVNFLMNLKNRFFKKDIPKTSIFNPQDIELKDDAFHDADILNYAEWWYFDAIFDNNYSAQITIYVFSVLNQKFIITGLNIYKDGLNVISREEYYIFNDLAISKEIPLIEVDGITFMKGYIDEASGCWTYNLQLYFADASVDLQFIGKSKGWKGDLSIGGWAAILPKAEVGGIINLFGTEFYVKGIGYHDHNWGMNLFDLIHFGWYWGRINTDNLTIVWFVILNSRFDSDNLCVISKDEGDYLNIDPNDIYFSAKDYNLDLIWVVPYSFNLKVDIEDIYLSIVMNTKSIDSDFKINGHYWRYHINCLGNVIINGEIKSISGIQIAEFMRLR